MKTLILKRNQFWSEGREDYSAYDDGKKIGRICFGAGWNGKMWLWAVSDWGSDLADTLDEAKQRLKEKYLAL